MKNFDSQEFKIRDAASYDELTAQFDYFTGLLSRPLASHLVSLAEISPASKILDVGTGTGIAAAEAAAIINSSGEIYGIDLSEKMLSGARAKTDERNLARKIEFCRMDAEHLGFENEKFDVVISMFALLHFPNPAAALAEIYRVLRPGGKLVLGVGSGAAVFSLPGWIHLFKKAPDLWRDFRGKRLTAPHFLDSLVRQYISDKDAPEESNLAAQPHRHRTGTIVSLVKKAGFNIVKTDWRGHQEIIETPQEFWEIQRTFSTLARKRLNEAEPAEFEAVYGAFTEKCRLVKSRGGSLVYPFGAFFVVANRPV